MLDYDYLLLHVIKHITTLRVTRLLANFHIDINYTYNSRLNKHNSNFRPSDI